MQKLFLVGATSGIPTAQGPVGGGVRVLEHFIETLPEYFKGALVHLYGSAHYQKESHSWGESIGLPVSVLEQSSTQEIIHLSEIKYSQFALQFEKKATEFLKTEGKPADIVFINDISEGPDFKLLSNLGFVVVPLFHIAVAEFFCKLYLRNIFSAGFISSFFHKLEDTFGRWCIPKLLQLVFSKERAAVRAGDLLVVPSQGLKEALIQCYGVQHQEKIKVIPWNLISHMEEKPLEGVNDEILKVKEKYQIMEGEKIWMTLSRISWEKGLEILLAALEQLPREMPFRVFICGDAAYMGGKKYLARLKKRAKLFSNRVEFPGYLHGVTKEAFFKMADLFISTSHYEAYGLTLEEATGHQLPILSLDHHGARQHQKYLTLVPGQRKKERIANLVKALQAEPNRKTPSEVTQQSAASQIMEYLSVIKKNNGLKSIES